MKKTDIARVLKTVSEDEKTNSVEIHNQSLRVCQSKGRVLVTVGELRF
jgi:hypothetical protein